MPARQHLRVLFLRSGRIIAQVLLRPDARRSTSVPSSGYSYARRRRGLMLFTIQYELTDNLAMCMKSVTPFVSSLTITNGPPIPRGVAYALVSCWIF